MHVILINVRICAMLKWCWYEQIDLHVDLSGVFPFPTYIKRHVLLFQRHRNGSIAS